PRSFCPQLGIIDHFVDVAEPVRPVEIVAARERGELAISPLVESGAARTVLTVGRAAASIACLGALSAALLPRLSLAIPTALTTSLLLARLLTGALSSLRLVTRIFAA